MLLGYIVSILICSLFPPSTAFPFSPIYFQAVQNIRKFDRIHAFGDSLTDGGTGAWKITNHTWPADFHYSKHRFSNGDVYVQALAKTLQLPLIDSAVGGATTGTVQGFTGPDESIPSPSVLAQVENYLQSDKVESIASTLFVINGGGNDAYFGLPNVTANQVAASLREAVLRLKRAGATRFTLPNLPAPRRPSLNSLGPVPFAKQLRHELRKLGKANSEQILVADLYSLYTRIYEDPATYNFTNIDEACLQGVYLKKPEGITYCGDDKVDGYVRFDEYHPTRRVHALIAEAIIRQLRKKGWI